MKKHEGLHPDPLGRAPRDDSARGGQSISYSVLARLLLASLQAGRQGPVAITPRLVPIKEKK